MAVTYASNVTEVTWKPAVDTQASKPRLALGVDVVQPLMLYALPVEGLPPLYATVTPRPRIVGFPEALLAPPETAVLLRSKFQLAMLVGVGDCAEASEDMPAAARKPSRDFAMWLSTFRFLVAECELENQLINFA